MEGILIFPFTSWDGRELVARMSVEIENADKFSKKELQEGVLIRTMDPPFLKIREDKDV